MIIPFAQYAPDKADLDPSSTDMVRNVVPTSSGYGPLRAIAQFSSALPGVCRGARVARKSDGSYTLFAGTADSLYQLTGTAWDDVSNGSAPYTVGDGYSWSFTQFGPYVLATNINDLLQIYELGTSTDFADAGGSPPKAHYLYTESGYVGLAQLENFERRIMRSGLEDAEWWTIGHKGCTYQDLPDGGLVQGAVGSETGAFILSQSKSRLLTNQPGLEIGFTLADYEINRGTVAPFSVVRAGTIISFLSEDGFYILGQPSTPIGSERVDRTFLDDIDLDHLDQVQGVADPVRKMFWWRYRSLGGADNYSDKLIGYNYQLDRWTAGEVNLEWLISMATLGYTLEELDSTLGYTDLDALPYSLDSRVWKGGRPAFAAIDADHKLGFFEGEPLEALLETSTMRLGGDGRRGFVSGFRPMGDVSGAYGRAATAEEIGGTLTWGTESVQGTTGLIPVRSSGRVQRYRLRVPAGTMWNDLVGLEVPPESVRQAGRR
jgi:hypothetical protein